MRTTDSVKTTHDYAAAFSPNEVPQNSSLRIEGFGDAVGIEREGVTGKRRTLRSRSPFLKDPSTVQVTRAFQNVIVAEQESGKMSASSRTQKLPSCRRIRQEEAGVSAVRRIVIEQLVTERKRRSGSSSARHTGCAGSPANLPSEKSGGDSFPGNVTEYQPEPSSTQIEEVIVIAADLAACMQTPE